MRIKVNQHRCVGQGMCFLSAPDLFALSDEDGHAIVIQPDVPPELEEFALHAVRGCPEDAVEIEAS